MIVGSFTSCLVVPEFSCRRLADLLLLSFSVSEIISASLVFRTSTRAFHDCFNFVSTRPDMMNPAKDVLALASAEVDVSNIPLGEQMTLKWRGKPVFLWNRTDEQIAEAENLNIATLRDPETDAERVKKRRW